MKKVKLFLMVAFVATVFCTNTQAQVKVNSAGNVGIGTNNPTGKLHVNGKLFLDGVDYIGGWNYSYLQWAGHHLVIGSPVDCYRYNFLDLKPGGSAEGSLYSEFNMYTAISPNNHVLNVKINSNGLTYFNNPGNFGIGTNNPAQKLHVVGNSFFNGNVGIGENYNSIYKLRVGGQARFGAGWIGLILGWSTDDYCPAIYTEYNNALWLGRPDRWANHLWAYTIDYSDIAKYSDVRLKENVRLSPSILSKLKDVRTYNYNYTDECFKDFTLEQKRKAKRTEYGFLAQELQKIFPELVRSDDSGMLAIRYVEMIPILTLAINELQEKIETRDSIISELRGKMESLERILITCCGNKNQKTMQEFNLTNPTDDVSSEEMRIFQNAPNPFNESTIITCYIPEAIQKAELCVYDMQGSLIKCLLVSERGMATVQIQAGQLAAGIYTYLLIGDGKASEAKQMILTK
jgi:hypothetical protein